MIHASEGKMGNRRMKKTYTVAALLTLLLFTIMAVTACGSESNSTTEASTQTTAAASSSTTALSSTSSSQTGSSDTTPTTQAAGPATGTPYKIGVLNTMSGDFGFLGKDLVDTVNMELEIINANGGVNGHPLKLVVEDDATDPAKAVAGFTKLADDPEILAIIGPTFPHLLPATQPLADEKQVAYITEGPGLPALQEMNPKFTFYGALYQDVDAQSMLQIFQGKGLKNIAIISQNDPYALSVSNFLVEQAKTAGLQATLLSDTIDPGSMDVTPQVNKLKALIESTGADSIAINIYPNYISSFRKAAAAAGIDLPMVAYGVAADWSTLAMGGEELNGLMLPGAKVNAVSWLPDSDPQKAMIVEFTNRYQEKFGKVPGAVAVSAADVIRWLAHALQISGPDRVKLRDAIASTKDFLTPYTTRTVQPGSNSSAPFGTYVPMVIEGLKFIELKLQ
jgi:branched-chain amino acid transport system substrate-binding protein